MEGPRSVGGLPLEAELYRPSARSACESAIRVLFAALAMCAGFGVYLISDFYAFRILGLFVLLAMMIISLAALSLLPSLVVLFRPRFIFDPNTRARLRSAAATARMAS